MANQKEIIKQFKSELEKELNLELDAITEKIKDVAFNFVSNATDNTVVDTSQALSNWILTLDDPHSGVQPAHVEGKLGSTRDESKYKTLQEAALAVETFKLGDKIYIVNDLENEQHEKRAKTTQASEIAEEIALVEIQKLEILLEK